MSHLKFVPAIVVFLLCPLFGQPNATLRSHGVVKVNGVPATSSTVVMEGDRIDTGKNSSASLLLPGRMISVQSDPASCITTAMWYPVPMSRNRVQPARWRMTATQKDKRGSSNEKGTNRNA